MQGCFVLSHFRLRTHSRPSKRGKTLKELYSYTHWSNSRIEYNQDVIYSHTFRQHYRSQLVMSISHLPSYAFGSLATFIDVHSWNYTAYLTLRYTLSSMLSSVHIELCVCNNVLKTDLSQWLRKYFDEIHGCTFSLVYSYIVISQLFPDTMHHMSPPYASITHCHTGPVIQLLLPNILPQVRLN